MARATEIDAAPKIYVPLAQRPTDDIFLLVQPKVGSASALIPQVRAAIARVDTEQLVTVSDLMTEEIAADATSASFPRCPCTGLCEPGLAAGDGRRVRHSCLVGATTGTRLRRSHGCGCDRQR